MKLCNHACTEAEVPISSNKSANYYVVQIETRKEELETNLSTNLTRRQEELEAIISSADSEALSLEVKSKEQQLKQSKSNLDELTTLLQGIAASIDLSFAFVFY